MPKPKSSVRKRASTRGPIERPPAVRKTWGSLMQSTEWDVVDEASWESFPASDPPGYVRGFAAIEPPAPAEGDDEVREKTARN